tara:strand:- start:3481 stop:4071 length:591 start_codon:yes stop_codon:yes gene_type:complete
MLAQGAEARVEREGNTVLKDRFAKKYRLEEVDEKLRKQRTQREAKVLEKLQKAGIPCPELLEQHDTTLVLSFIEGEKLRDVLHQTPKKYGKAVGELIGKLHSHNIVHGDLTTSNMIVSDSLTLIDFGLSEFSQKIEDKAVDLHVLRQALESKHHKCWKACFNEVCKAYTASFHEGEAVLHRLETVEKRGRNKEKFI